LSPPKSGRGASSTGRQAAVRVSRPSGGGRVLVQAAKSDIYVALLGVSLGAIVLACILLAVVLARYEFKVKATAIQSQQLAAFA
jgi:hypothetical protein